jgi:hypothetical protein
MKTRPTSPVLLLGLLCWFFGVLPQASSQPLSALQLTVCATDTRTSLPVADAVVLASYPGLTPVQDTTDTTGCVDLNVEVSVGVEEDPTLPYHLVAGVPFPHPASDQVNVPFQVSQPQTVAFSLYDLQGRQVLAPVQQWVSGPAQVALSLSGLAQGVYLYRIQGAGPAVTGKLVKQGQGTGTGATAQMMPQPFTPAVGKAGATGAFLVHVDVTKDTYNLFSADYDVADGQTVSLGMVHYSTPLPLIDMTAGDTYYGFEGGLYPGGSNDMPEAHLNEGVARARAIAPLDANGNPSTTDKVLFLSVGYSNVWQEFWATRPDMCRVEQGSWACETQGQSWSFMGRAQADPLLNPDLEFLNGAKSGEASVSWDSPMDQNYDRVLDNVLTPFGYTEKQVQIIWTKPGFQIDKDSLQNILSKSLPDPEAEVYSEVVVMGNLVRSLKTRYPNLKLAFLSSRIYGGYDNQSVNPEPWAYETSFTVKWLIEAQIRQMETGEVDSLAGDLNYNTVAPWIAWGPYIWADTDTPRSDGLQWFEDDFEDDGRHPDRSGESKVGRFLYEFFQTSPVTACWFLEGGVCG